MATTLFLLVFLSILLDSLTFRTYVVHPDSCNRDDCFTFTDYANENQKYFMSNSIFQFLSGNHTLTSELITEDAHNTVNPHTASLI